MLPGKKLPPNWEQDTRFDGPEHWGMDPRWKNLFPKRGIRLDDGSSNVSSRNNSSSEESDGGDTTGAKDAAKSKLPTVDINQDADDDDFLRSSDDGDGHDETSLRLNVARRRRSPTKRPRPKRIPETAPASLVEPAGKANRSSASKRTERMDGTQAARRWRHGTRITDPASSSRVRAGQSGRSWARVGSGTSQLSRSRVAGEMTMTMTMTSSSEEEEEFDESEANITGHERGSPTGRAVITLHRQEQRNGGRTSRSPSSSARSRSSKQRRKGSAADDEILLDDDDAAAGGRGGGGAAGIGRGKGRGGGAASPVACDGSSDSSFSDYGASFSLPGRRVEGGIGGWQEVDDLVSSVSDSDDDVHDDGDSSCDNGSGAGSSGEEEEGRYTGRNASSGGTRGSKKSLSSPLLPGERGSGWHHTTSGGRGKGKGKEARPIRTPKGSVARAGGRSGKESRRRSSSSFSSSSRPFSPEGGGRVGGASASGGASKRLTNAQSGGKRARKVVHAKADENGWISKGGGGGGGGSSGGGSSAGGGRGRKDPVSSFQGPPASVRRNTDRGLTQSKINFPILD